MSDSRSHESVGEPEGTLLPPTLDEVEAGQPQAWEMIENCRYMPRRIRGSCLGRELG